jgi:hypothetical protein
VIHSTVPVVHVAVKVTFSLAHTLVALAVMVGADGSTPSPMVITSELAEIPQAFLHTA